MDFGLNKLGKPTHCKKCGTDYVYKSLGVYECPKCGFIEKDDYAKVREYIEENGASSAVAIASATGVTVSEINAMLREGRLEIPNGSGVFIRCETCGAEIRFGRLCPACAAKLSSDFKGYAGPSVGETPSNKDNKMRFIGRDKKR